MVSDKTLYLQDGSLFFLAMQSYVERDGDLELNSFSDDLLLKLDLPHNKYSVQKRGHSKLNMSYHGSRRKVEREISSPRKSSKSFSQAY